MDLAGVANGASALVIAVDLDPAARLRLGEVGVRPGAVVTVTGNGPSGARVLAIGADRLAIDKGTCERVAVHPFAATASSAGDRLAFSGAATTR